MNAQDEELEPLSELAMRAFAAERGRSAPSVDSARDAQAARILGRVLVTVGAGAATTAALAGAAGSAKAASTAGGAVGAGAAAGAGAGAATGAGAGAGAAAGAALSLKVVVGIAAVAFAAGTGTGVVLQRSASPVIAAPTAVAPAAPPASSQTAAPLLTATADPTVPTTLATLATGGPTSSHALPVPPIPSATVAPSGSGADADLASERSLIDRARSALARGDTAACIEATSAHAKRFPGGRLGEERELIAIQALVRDNQLPAARARANRFRKAYPKSMFLPAVDRIVPPTE